jgi:hypothetical protein
VSDPPTDASSLDIVSGGNTADVLVTDPDGLETGVTNAATGDDVQDIPQSYHFVDELDNDDPATAPFAAAIAHTVGIVQPAQGTYQIAVVGLSLGAFNVQVLPIATDGTPIGTTSLIGIANAGTQSAFNIKLSTAPGATLSVQRVATYASTILDVKNGLQLKLIANQELVNLLTGLIQSANVEQEAGRIDAAKSLLDLCLFSVNVSQKFNLITGVEPQLLVGDVNSLKTQLP